MNTESHQQKKLNNPVVDFEFYQTQPNGKTKPS